jgi:hypothetical protein
VSAIGPASVSAGGDIHGGVSTTYVGTMRGKPLEVAQRNLARIFKLVQVNKFVGRDWLLADLATFTGSHDRGYFLLEADAGLGKSTFAAWLVAHRGYPGHFTRLDGGANSREALLNLSAQLIKGLDLFDDIERQLLLPGLDRALVPEWTGEPAGFASLLEVAAAKAEERGAPIVLVVDGMDEESPLSAPVPLGLPSSLPEHVYVVATCRTGTPIAAAHTAFTVARISADDPRNLADMRTYVANAAAEPELAERLAAKGISSDDFVNKVTAQCGGVWIYVAHLLPDFRSGELDVGDIDWLPVKLSQYFAANLAAKRADPRWATEDLPLLGALGAAAEPVSTTTLSAWTGIGNATVRNACVQRYRAFLRVGQVEHGGKKFAVYHRSLNDFLAGQSTDRSTVLQATSDLIDEVAEQVTEAHDRIAAFYLSRFEGDPRAFANLHGGYGLRFLTAHMRTAGQHRDIRHLLSPEGNPPVSNWFATHARHGDVNAYTADILAELAPARYETNQQPVLHAGLESVRFEVFSAVFLASRITDPGDVPMDLIDSFLTWGVWTTDEARSQIEPVSNAGLRATGLLAIAPRIPPMDRDACLRDASALIGEIANNADRVDVQVKLLDHLSPDDAAELRARLVETTQSIKDPGDAGRTLLTLLPHVPETERQPLYEKTIGLLRTAHDQAARAQGLAEAVRFAPPGEAGPLAAEALTLTNDSSSTVLAQLQVPGLDLRTTVIATLLESTGKASLWTQLRAADTPDGYEGVARAITLARYAATPAIRQELTRSALYLARDIPDARLAAKAMVRVHHLLVRAR